MTKVQHEIPKNQNEKMYNVKRKTSFYPYVYLKRKGETHWNRQSKMNGGKSMKFLWGVRNLWDILLVLVLKYIPLENQNEKTILSTGPFDLFRFNETSATWNVTNRHTEHGNKLEATRNQAIKVEAMLAGRSSFRKFMDWRIPARLATRGETQLDEFPRQKAIDRARWEETRR